jgi:hypothetical protein
MKLIKKIILSLVIGTAILVIGTTTGCNQPSGLDKAVNEVINKIHTLTLFGYGVDIPIKDDIQYGKSFKYEGSKEYDIPANTVIHSVHITVTVKGQKDPTTWDEGFYQNSSGTWWCIHMSKLTNN